MSDYKGWVGSGQGFAEWKRQAEKERLKKATRAENEASGEAIQTPKSNETAPKLLPIPRIPETSRAVALEVSESIDEAFERLSRDVTGGD